MDAALLQAQLLESPPNTAYLKQILEAFRAALCRFVPNKTDIHALIEEDRKKCPTKKYYHISRS